MIVLYNDEFTISNEKNSSTVRRAISIFFVSFSSCINSLYLLNL